MPEVVSNIIRRFTDTTVSTHLNLIAAKNSRKPLLSFLNNPAFQMAHLPTEVALRQLDADDIEEVIYSIRALRDIYVRGNTFADTVSRIRTVHQVTWQVLHLATAFYEQ